MAIRAIVFDIGGVLERVEEPGSAAMTTKWRGLLGLSPDEFSAALRLVDPDDLIQTGAMTEAEYASRYATALHLTAAQSAEFMADMWDWYCGELDEELMTFAASLRSRVVTAILSNSADGARREELARYSFDRIFDPIIYSHEVGLAKPDPAVFELTCALTGAAPDEMIFIDDHEPNIEAAIDLGIHAILHKKAPETITAVTALVEALRGPSRQH